MIGASVENELVDSAEVEHGVSEARRGRLALGFEQGDLQRGRAYLYDFERVVHWVVRLASEDVDGLQLDLLAGLEIQRGVEVCLRLIFGWEHSTHLMVGQSRLQTLIAKFDLVVLHVVATEAQTHDVVQVLALRVHPSVDHHQVVHQATPHVLATLHHVPFHDHFLGSVLDRFRSGLSTLNLRYLGI